MGHRAPRPSWRVCCPGSCHLQTWALWTVAPGQRVQCPHDSNSGAMGSRTKGSRTAGSSEIASLRLVRELLNLSYFILRILVGTRIKSRWADPQLFYPSGWRITTSFLVKLPVRPQLRLSLAAACDHRRRCTEGNGLRLPLEQDRR